MEFKRHKKPVIFLLTLFFMFLLFVTWNIYVLMVTPVLSGSNPTMIITLDSSATASQFVHLLKEKKLIQSSRFLSLMIRLEGLSHQLKAGVYQIKPGESAMKLFHRVVEGDVLTQNFVIIEGTTQQKISQDLLKAAYLHYQPEDWLAIIDNHLNAEGLLLADTYQYRGGSAGRLLLEHAHRNLINYLNNAWARRSPGLPYKSAYELLIAASIIEKETAIPQERKLIAGVLINRLKKNMPLQMDPTVIYGMGAAYTGKLSHNNLQINSPYNTYRYRGLPPTPIAMVGKEAIDAASQPQQSNYLYFVAKGDGSHQFSENYEQQKQAIEHNRHKDLK
jgi:UPF0755 protein